MSFYTLLMQLGRICAQCVRGDKTYRLQITLCFRWRGGAVRLPPRQAHFLHRPLQYIKTPKDGPLPKYSQSLQSAKTPHSQPSLSPIHYWGIRGDTALATQAQGTAAQEKVGHGGGLKLGWSTSEFKCSLFLRTAPNFFSLSFQISPTRGIL